MSKGRFFVISAPSGTGKTTVVAQLLKEDPGLVRSVSCTTRARRPSEREGIDYRFVTPEVFQRMIEAGELFEWQEVHGSLYGTPKAALLERREAGTDTVLDIDVRGALNLKKAFPESCLIFLQPPSFEVLEGRLKNRKTEGEDSVRRRLEWARAEITMKDRFDHVVVNDRLDRAVGEIRRIVSRERKELHGSS